MTPPSAGRSGFKADLVTGYLLSAGRLASWGLAIGWMTRYGTAEGLAILTASRAWATVAVHSALSAGQVIVPLRTTGEESKAVQLAAGWTAWQVAVLGSAGALGLSLIASGLGQAGWVIIMLVCLAQGLRNSGDVGGGLLQRWGRLWLDNLLQLAGEVLWIAMAAVLVLNRPNGIPLSPGDIAIPMVVAAGLAMAARWQLSGIASALLAGRAVSGEVRKTAATLATRIRREGASVTVGNLSALLFAPITTLLLGWMLGPKASEAALSAYAPLLLIDGGLVMLASGIGQALFPRLAQACRDVDAHRYLRLRLVGTVAVTAAVGFLACVIWLTSGQLLPIWLGRLDPSTATALPWVLLHSALGASVAVTNSCLIAAGRGRTSALIGLASGLVSVLGVTAVLIWARQGETGAILRAIAWTTTAAVALRAVACWHQSRRYSPVN